jgi:hypothetical protein
MKILTTRAIFITNINSKVAWMSWKRKTRRKKYLMMKL